MLTLLHADFLTHTLHALIPLILKTLYEAGATVFPRTEEKTDTYRQVGGHPAGKWQTEFNLRLQGCGQRQRGAAEGGHGHCRHPHATGTFVPQVP